MTAPFNPGKHPRVAGGRFGATAAAQAAASGHPTGAWAAGPMSFNAKTGQGTGYGGRDPRVVALQQALTRLGLGDSQGRALRVDGQLGPLTTSAVKAFQRANGLPQTGVVDAKLMVAILTAKPPVPKPVLKPAPPSARARMNGGRGRGRGHGRSRHKGGGRAAPSPPPVPWWNGP